MQVRRIYCCWSAFVGEALVASHLSGAHKGLPYKIPTLNTKESKNTKWYPKGKMDLGETSEFDLLRQLPMAINHLSVNIIS